MRVLAFPYRDQGVFHEIAGIYVVSQTHISKFQVQPKPKNRQLNTGNLGAAGIDPKAALLSIQHD